MVYDENVIEFFRGDSVATATLTQGRFITKVKKLAEDYPDEVQIVTENKDGSIVAKLPTKAIHLGIIRREMTDEQKEAARERFRKMREQKEFGKYMNEPIEEPVGDTDADFS